MAVGRICLVTCRFGELERRQVVMCQHIGHILDALGRLLLDPSRRRAMPGDAASARDLRVADISHEHVGERVLLFVLHRTHPGLVH